MNWFQRLLNNPNAHILGAMAAGAASVALPAYAPALQVVAGVLGTAGVALPEAPAAPVAPAAPPVALPPAVGGGAYHPVDYANLAAALLAEMAKPAGRS
jgi:hypothetical protein